MRYASCVHTLLIVCLIIVLADSVSKVNAAENIKPIPYKNTIYSQLPSITALLKRYNLRDKTTVLSSWVVLSPQGMHVSDSEGSPEVLKNFNSKRIWMIDRKRKMYYALEIDKYTKEFPELAANLFSSASASNLIGQNACEGWFGELKGERVWRGHVVQEWQCTDEQNIFVNKQYFSVQYGLVVRVESSNLSVDELTNIKILGNNEYIFKPTSSFYPVSKEQFVSGRAELKPYKNP